MIVWIDAQLSPALAPWLAQRFGIEVHSLKFLGYRDAADYEIFHAAREAGAVVMTKDGDFLRLQEQPGAPPQVLWVTLGNTSNARMKEMLEATFSRAQELLQGGESLVELRDLQ